jgi:aryl-alcohol dehydrogenase-like predicted oxidoreductase
MLLGKIGLESFNGVSDEEESIAILKECYDAGLRTFDTADVYSSGNSERVIGKFLKQHNIPRENVVIMTKCYFHLDLLLGETGLSLNNKGLSRKHIMDAVKGSVERLGTHIDLLQIHRYDPEVPDEEVMRALNDVVESGQVRYLGASSMKTYQFIGLQNTAEKHGWHKFVSMQSMYNLIYREDERELNEYCQKTGVGLIPWSPNARGLLAVPFESEKTQEKIKNTFSNSFLAFDLEHDKVIIDRVEEVSKKLGCTMVEVACAWLIAKGAHPIIGVTLKDAIEPIVKLADIKLTEEQVKYLEEPYRSKAPAWLLS